MITQEHTAPDGGCKNPHVQIFSSDATHPPPTDSALAAERLSRLSPRESEVLNRVAAGQSTKVIAAALGLSPKTVDCHRSEIMRKAECRSLFELGAVWALATGAQIDPAPRTSLPPYATLGGGVALRTALATVSAASGDPSHCLPSIDRLTVEQLRQRALEDRKDAQAAVQCRDIVTAAMLLADADRCEGRAERLEERRALQKQSDGGLSST